MNLRIAIPWVPVFANDNSALIPQVWAQESLMILYAKTVMLPLVHRDFKNEIASFGDTVNTRRPAKFTAVMKADGDSVTIQDATSTNVAIKLDRHLHTSFIIYDGEESKGFKSLREMYLVPALESIAQQIDLILHGQGYQFLGNAIGQLGVTPTKTTIIAAREKMNGLLAPAFGRNFVITDNTEGALLGIDNFISADKVGDDGTALREGSLGRKYGFQIHHSQNTPSIAVGSTIDEGTVNNGSGYAAGLDTMTTANLSGDWLDGQWFTVAGDMVPHLVTDHTVGTEVIFTPVLASDVVDSAVITRYTPGAVNFGDGYDVGYGKVMTVNGFAVAPKTGQLVTIAEDPGRYGALATPTTTKVTLSHTLSTAAVNADVVGLGPTGDYNLAFHRNAIGFISRPLTAPDPETGARSFVADMGGLSIRVTIWYDGNKQGHLVTVDILAGVKVFDVNLGCVVLA